MERSHVGSCHAAQQNLFWSIVLIFIDFDGVHLEFASVREVSIVGLLYHMEKWGRRLVFNSTSQSELSRIDFKL